MSVGRFAKILKSYLGPTDIEKAAAREERISHGGQVGFRRDGRLRDGTEFFCVVEEIQNRDRVITDWWLIEMHGRFYKLSNNSLFIFRQELYLCHEARKLALWITEWPWFERVIIALIFANCLLMALPASYDPVSAHEEELKIFSLINGVCVGFFTLECALKIIARGVFWSDAPDKCYLGEWSNCFDFAVVVAGILEVFVINDESSSKLILIRSFRILRPLRTINRLPHLQMIVASLIDSTPRLLQWLLTVLFISTLFTIVGTSIFGTVYWHRCRLTAEPIRDAAGQLHWPVDPAQTRFCGGRYECQRTADGMPTFCGSVVDPLMHSGARLGMSVWPEINESEYADFGYSGFQTFLSGLMTIFRVATMEGWAEILYRFQDGRGDFLALVYFIGLLIYGGLVLLNLALAILWRSFEEKIRTHSNGIKEMEERIYPPEIEILKLDELVTKVHEIEAELKSSKIYEKLDQSAQTAGSGAALMKLRSICLSVVNAPGFDAVILWFIVINCAVLAIDAYPPPDKLLIKLTEQLNVYCTIVFTAEAVFRIISYGFKYFQDYFNIFDLSLVIVSLIELAIGGQSTVSALRVSRLLRIFKIFGQSVPMRVLFRVMGKSAILSYNFCIIVVLVLVGWSLVAVHFFYDKSDQQVTQIKFESFIWAFIAMFQLLCGERWHKTMVEHARNNGDSPFVVIFFITVFVSCHLILMNLFLGMFVAAFAIARENVIDENRLKLLEYQNQSIADDKAKSPKKKETPAPPPEPESPRWPQHAVKKRWYTKTCATDMNALRMLRVKRAAAGRAAARGDKLVLATTDFEASAPRKPSSNLDRSSNSQNAASMARIRSSLSDGDKSKNKIIVREADSEMPISMTTSLLRSPEHHASPPKNLPSGRGAGGIMDFIASPRPPIRCEEEKVHQSPPPAKLEADSELRRAQHHPSLRRRFQVDRESRSVASAELQALSFRQAYESARLRADLHVDSLASDMPNLRTTMQATHQAEEKCTSSCRGPSNVTRLCAAAPAGSGAKLQLASYPAVRPPSELRLAKRAAHSGSCPEVELAGIWLKDVPKSSGSAESSSQRDSCSHCSDEMLHGKFRIPLGDALRENCDKDLEACSSDHVLVPMGVHTASPPAVEAKPNCVRRGALAVVRQAWFEPAVLVFIGISSVCLAIETPYTKTDSRMFALMQAIEQIVSFSFLFEMLVKIVAFGVWAPKVRSPTGDAPYFQTAWNWLDCLVVLTSIVDFVFRQITDEEDKGLRVVRAMRLLRVLRPLRIVRRNKGLKIIVEALIKSFPTLVRVLMVSSLFYIGFAILFMNLLKGELWRCSLDPTGLLRSEIVTRADCEAENGTWINARSHFDQIGSSIVTLLHIGTGEGWIEVMKDMVNSVGIDKQPRRNSRILFSFTIIVFVALSRFFIVNLLIGVMIDQYCATRDIMLGVELRSVIEKRWIHTQRRMLSVRDLLKPNFKIHGRCVQLRKRLERIVFSQACEVFIFFAILGNSFLLCLLHPTMGEDFRRTFDALSVMFVVIFNLEVATKVFVRFADYYVDPWNTFDFVVVIGSDASMIAAQFSRESAPDVVQVLNAFRIMRVIRLVRVSQFLRRQCATLLALVPAFMNISLLLILLLFLYACLGVGLFATVAPGPDLNHDANFQSFSAAFLLVLRVSTGENWQRIMYDVSEDRPNCTTEIQTAEELEREGPRGCGSFLAYPYFVSFTSFVSIIMMNMIVAVVLDQFQSVEQSASIEFYTEQVRMLGRRWRRQDKDLTGYLPIDEAIIVLQDVPPPIGFQDRTARKTRHMMRLVPLFGKSVHIRDVLMLSTKRVYCWMHNQGEDTTSTVKLDEQVVNYWLSIWPEIPQPHQVAEHFVVAHVILSEYLAAYLRRQRQLAMERAEQAAIKEEEDLERQMKSKGARAAAALLAAPNQKANRVLAGRNAAGLPLRILGDPGAPGANNGPLSCSSEASQLNFDHTVLVGSGFDDVD